MGTRRPTQKNNEGSGPPARNIEREKVGYNLGGPGARKGPPFLFSIFPKHILNWILNSLFF